MDAGRCPAPAALCPAPAALCLLLLASPAAADDGGWLTNYDQLRQVTRQAVGDLLEDFAPVSDPPVRIAFESPHEATWMVEQLLGEELGSLNVAVVRDSTVAATELAVKVVELGLRYTGTSRRNLLGGKRVERFTIASLSAQTRSPGGGALAWSGVGEARVIDEVPAGKLPLLEGPSYPFTAPAMPPSNSAKVIEPILVSTIVVSLVFLFVSNRK